MGRIARRLGCAAAAVLIILAAFAPAAAGPKTYVYDSLGRLSSVTNADGSIVTYAYDAADNRTAISTTPAGPPVLANETATLSQNSTNNEIGLNQTGGGTPTSASVIAQPTHGTTSVSGTHIYYTPTPGYTGPDSYQYNAANSSGASNTVTATITVILVPPTTGYSSATVAYNSSSNPIPLTIGGGTTAAVTVGTPPSHGVATASGTSITYTPTAGFSGYDNFTFTASNAAGSSGPGNVAITVTPQPPVAGPVSVTMSSNDTNVGISPNLSGGATSSVAVVGGPSHGTVSISGPHFSYYPTSGYIGNDSFQYTATNAGGTSSSATVTITISQPVVAPTLGYTTATVSYGSVHNAIPINLYSGNPPTSYAIASQGSHGSASTSGGVVYYSPAGGYSGSDSFTVTASNSAGTSPAGTVAITVTPQAPVTGPVSVVTYSSSTNVGITPSLSGGTTSSVSVVSGPAHGSVTISGPHFSYYLSGGFVGDDTFQYVATGPGGTSNTSTVTITIRP